MSCKWAMVRRKGLMGDRDIGAAITTTGQPGQPDQPDLRLAGLSLPVMVGPAFVGTIIASGQHRAGPGSLTADVTAHGTVRHGTVNSRGARSPR